MKTILHVIDTTGPGGAETVFIEMVRDSMQQGWKVICLIRGPGWVKDRLDEFGATVKVVNCKGAFNVRYLLTLMGEMRGSKVDVVHSHLLGSNVYCSIAGLLTAKKIICTFHGHVDVQERERLRWLKFFIIRLGARKVVAVTKSLELMLQRLVGRQNTIVIPNGINLELYSKKANAAPETDSVSGYDAIKIGSLGNIRKAKNYLLAIEIVGALLSRGLKIEYYIAGDPKKELMCELEKRVVALGITESVKFLGFVEDVPRFLRSLDLFLITSSSEGHPLALTQAMATGLPIISTKCGVEEIIDNTES